MIDATNLAVIRDRLIERAGEIAIAFMGEPNRGMSSKRELRFGRHGSLAIAIAGPKAGLWHDHEIGEGGDLFKLIERERRVGFADALKIAADLLAMPEQPRHAPQFRPVPSTSRPGTSASSNDWLDIWREAVDPCGTPVTTYLARRNVPLPDEAAGEAIRFHPRCKFGLHRVPCMVALVRNIETNKPQAIHRTALDLAGNKIEIDGMDRMGLGPVHGGAVKLSPEVTTCVGLAEGIESALSMRSVPQFGASPVWSLLSAAGIKAFPVLSGIETIWIAVDHDKSSTGQRAAMACSARWTAAGREVFRIIPNQLGDDLNDLARRAS
jgi:hypothetical protein